MKNSHSFRLESHLPYLLRRGHFDAEAVFARMYGNTITTPQLSLLLTVGLLPGASQSQIANEIGLDLNTCGDLIARTIKKGLLIRERSPADKRTFCVYLTEEGKKLSRESIVNAPEYQAAVARNLSAQELEQLIGLLQKMLKFDSAE
ncbi:MarR family winged helix-turn-helix transcriptional regulator [Paraburkholderia ferrariae]|uniref:MarR family winged helix-turn-helix transcriptional regulator n=1 Tax=Paraburkholderia ferrariae TaxID=386056 RepID=UPI000693CD68|nr:MarR family transcriptional regulator [Paraburkholderia ferrariae]